MNELTVYVDEFGNITERNPCKAWGSGCFACYNKDISFLNSELKKYFPKKIHIRELRSVEEVHDEVIKVSKFLKKCGRKFYAGGIGASKPRAVMEKLLKKSEINSTEIKKNYTLENFILITLHLVSSQIARHHMKDHYVKLNFIFEEAGNSKDYELRAREIEEALIHEVDHMGKLLEKRLQENKNIERPPTIEIVSIKFLKSSDNVELGGIADVFAHITGRIFNNSEDNFSKKLHGIMEPHFNLFDYVPTEVKEIIITKGILNLHKKEEWLNYEGEGEYIKASQQYSTSSINVT